ncbi:AAA family ATPase [candidate division TA06 bacterium]|nr:AAA family ATPase [candidate division TA06 bacterium]
MSSIFDEILNKQNGAVFYRADLHIHTPFWHHFKKPTGINTNDAEWKKQYALEFVNKAIEKKLAIIGITEHNDVTWADLIINAAKGKPIKVFPGFEITTMSGSDGIHLLCLFNDDIGSEKLDGLISQFGLLPGNRFFPDNTPKAAEKDANSIIEEVKKNNGICIAAHMSSSNGLLAKTEGQIRINIFTNQELLAGEIPAEKNKLGKFESEAVLNKLDLYKRKFPIACLNSSDAKSLDEIGSKYTYIKMSSLTIEGLREAFLDWESRIRLSNEIPVQAPRYSKIIAAKWEGGFLNGIDIRFNDNLNCVIGGKGTGKSTIIETIRYAFDVKSTVDKIEEQNDDVLKNVFKSGSKISLLLETHEPSPRRYLLERTYPESPVVKDIESGEKTELRPKDIMGLEVYSQKEIYEISKDRAFQLKLLDRFIGNQTDGDKENIKQIKISLSKTKDDIKALLKLIQSDEEEIALLPSIEEKIKAYKTIGINDKLNEKRLYSKEEYILKQSSDKLNALKRIAGQFKNSIDLKIEISDDDKLPNYQLLKELESLLNSLQGAVDTNIANIAEAYDKTIASYNALNEKWNELNHKQNERYGETLRELQKTIKDVDPNELIKLEQRVGALRDKKKNCDKNKEKLVIVGKKRNDLLADLQDKRGQVFRKSNEIINAINDKLAGTLQIILKYQEDKSEFVRYIRQLKSGAREEQITKITSSVGFNILEFTNTVKSGPDALSKKYDIQPATAQSICKSLINDAMMEMELLEIPTVAFIELNLGTKENPIYRNIDNLSVGQKCTALLMLILLENPYPLVIDQPEDDLDNAFIVNDIVNRLRNEKERRQFIVVTHNANLPVLGDAELIVPLEASQNQANIKDGVVGSIDDNEMKEIVKNTLEGGNAAFEIRKQKYGI